MRITNFTPYKKQNAPSFGMELSAHPDLRDIFTKEFAQCQNKAEIFGKPYSRFLGIIAQAVQIFHLKAPINAKCHLRIENVKGDKCDLIFVCDPPIRKVESRISNVSTQSWPTACKRIMTSARRMSDKLTARRPDGYLQRVSALRQNHAKEEAILKRLQGKDNSPFDILDAFDFMKQPKPASQRR